MSACSAGNGLNVRAEPSRNSRVIDVLPNHSTASIDQRVSLANPPTWVPLRKPTQGYVHSNYLLTYSPAKSKIITGVPCANSQDGLNVRERPTTESSIITTLSDSETVNVSETLNASYWVKINDPVNGFVNSKYLGGGPHYMGPCEA